MTSIAHDIRDTRLDGYTVSALVVTLLALPMVWSSGLIGQIVEPIFTEHSRRHWWYFWIAGVLVHWIPFAFVWLALQRNGESWESIGVQWGWFRKRSVAIPLIVLVVGLVAGAFIAPLVYYGDTPPGMSRTIFIAPVSTVERLAMIFIAITAGVTEEVLFRGFAFTRLMRVARNIWLVLPVTLISFIYLHGSPRDAQQFFTYLMAGLAFSIPFILMKFRRLEVLILIHFLIDAGMVIAP